MTFVIGFLYALSVNNLKSEYKNFDKVFQEFAVNLGINKGMFVHHYYIFAKYFLEESKNDEERAFDLFYATFEEFKLEKEDLDEK